MNIVLMILKVDLNIMLMILMMNLIITRQFLNMRKIAITIIQIPKKI